MAVVPTPQLRVRFALTLAFAGTALAAAIPQAPELARMETAIRQAPNVAAGRAAVTKYRDAVAVLKEPEVT